VRGERPNTTQGTGSEIKSVGSRGREVGLFYMCSISFSARPVTRSIGVGCPSPPVMVSWMMLGSSDVMGKASCPLRAANKSYLEAFTALEVNDSNVVDADIAMIP
jgi:hypothetical protein